MGTGTGVGVGVGWGWKQVEGASCRGDPQRLRRIAVVRAGTASRRRFQPPPQEQEEQEEEQGEGCHCFRAAT